MVDRRLAPLVALFLAFAAAAAGAQTPGPGTDAGRRIAVDGHLLSSSPDGRRLAVAGEGFASLCVYAVADPAAPPLCADLVAAGLRGVDHLSVVWSPAGDRLAFADLAVQQGRDGDIWLMDGADGVLTNLTDDGIAGRATKHGIGDVPVDDLPAWSPDGAEVAFVRSTVRDGASRGTALMRVSAAGGEPTEIATLSETEPFLAELGMAYAPDGRSLLFSVVSDREPRYAAGIWAVDPAGGEPHPVAPAPRPEDRGYLLEVSPRGDRALLYLLGAAGDPFFGSAFALLDLATGAVTRVELGPDAERGATPRAAAFSPDGARLLVHGAIDGELLVRDAAGGPDRLLAEVPADGPPASDRGALRWTGDGVLFVAVARDATVVLRTTGA